MRRTLPVISGLMIVVFSVVPPAHAQSAAPDPPAANSVSQTSFPGSAWVNSGFVSPLEPGNLLTTYFFEQGITVAARGAHRLAPYAAVSITQDREGLDWNNKAVSQVGLKYSRAFRNGVVQLSAGYAYERRMRSSLTMGQPIGLASYWFGWNRDLPGASSRRVASSFPGTSWAAVGNHAPAEGHNVIATLYVQQGVTLASFSRISIIPFVEHTLTMDAAGHSWNNRRIFGEGFKVQVPVGTGVLETAVIYKHERRWRDRQSGDGLTASVNLWYGWNPSKTHKEK